MLFIPQEIKEKLTELEEENKRLEAENNRLKYELASPIETSKRNNLVWVLGILLLFAVLYIVFGIFFSEKQETVVEEDLSAVVIRDGKIEKWNRVDDGSLVYRVQLGAYEGFDIDKYKQNIEGLYQDSIDGFHKISLGAFSRLRDAQEFQGSLVRMGMQNVYIVAYENKQPIGLIEAEKEEK